MWIVRLALKRPYTFVVLAMLIVIMGIVTLASMATDMLPEIDIPVIAVINQYTGLSPDEVAARITSPFERATTTTVNGKAVQPTGTNPVLFTTEIACWL